MNKKWNIENIKDQSGKVAIVTGANTGIGYETARVLAGKNALVVLACRSVDKARAAADKIKTEFPEAKLDVLELDLSSLNSVSDFVGAFQKKYNELHLLINNAGVMIPPYTKTAEGFELQFGTNHLGHYKLTGLLLDSLLKTDSARIVNVASMAHKSGKLDFSDLNWEKRKYSPMRAYGDSKIANLYFTYELQKKLKAKGASTIAVAAHPGYTATDLARHNGVVDFMGNFFAQSIPMGALPTLYAAVADDVEGGDYYGPAGFMEMRGYPVKVESNGLSRSEKIATRLWDVSRDLTGTAYAL